PVTTDCKRPFAVFAMVTVTPGSAAPDWSVTAPLMLAAPAMCADAGAVAIIVSRQNMIESMRIRARVLGGIGVISSEGRRPLPNTRAREVRLDGVDLIGRRAQI